MKYLVYPGAKQIDLKRIKLPVMKAYTCLLLCAIMTLEACTKSDRVNNDPGSSFSALNQQVPNAQVDSAVANFIKKYNIPGVSVAISRNGKMVYLKGYGYADIATKKNVTISSLFRIANLSKTFTSVAIMKLIEDKRLSIDATVFGTNGILGNAFGSLPYNDNLQKITVRQLLQETTGWTSDASDPMLTNPNLTQQQLISWTLDNRVLSIPSGSQYLPSNFVYCLLKQIIEKQGNASYTDFLKVKILEPCGISDMQIGNDRKPNEVTYYGENGDDPYGFNINRMDASSGWLASAEDILKFLVSTDGFATKADLLTASSINTMKMASKANPDYACGWFVNNADDWWNIGNMPGSSTEMVRTSNGYCWAILCNSRSTSSTYIDDLNNLIWFVINNKATQWPPDDIDLF